jgi:hypothetical protein
MKISKLFPVLVIVVLSLALFACAPAQGFAQTVVELPSPIQLFILTAATFVVGFIVTKLAELWPVLGKLLGPYVDEVSMAVAGAIVLEIQNLLNAIPPEWEGVANAALALVVAILGAYGFLLGTRKAAYMFAVRKLTEK